MKKHFSLTHSEWTRKEIDSLNKHKDNLFDIERRKTMERILSQEANRMDFYKITPKEDLPKSLQKMSFQTMNTKQVNAAEIVKIFKKKEMSRKQKKVRESLKKNGEIMLLSQIYNYLDDPLGSDPNSDAEFKSDTNFTKLVGELDEWEKNSTKNTLECRFGGTRYATADNYENKRDSFHKKEYTSKKFKAGSDHRAEVQKSLEGIYNSHSNEPNLMSRCVLIQSASKGLKKELDEFRETIQKQIGEKKKKIIEARKEHHSLFEEKFRLQLEQSQMEGDKDKEDELALKSLGYSYHNIGQINNKNIYEDKRAEIEKNQTKISKVKKNIQLLEQQIIKNQEELKNIFLAETAYYKISLKNGVDCRSSGLTWVIKKIGIQECEQSQADFPEYLDKKSRHYLIQKSRNEELLEDMLNEKRQFVNNIGKQSSQRSTRNSYGRRKNSIKFDGPSLTRIPFDQIRQTPNNQMRKQIPKRYRRSMKKITALREQFIKNENLLKLSQSRKGFKFGDNVKGMTGKQIYNTITQKMRSVDFNQLKKENVSEKNDKIYEYQMILRKIEQLHMEMQQLDIQHENYLLVQYRDNKNLFFQISAACFGAKRAYSLIIKHFSWKNSK